MTGCKSILELKCTHPIGMIFDEIRFGPIFLNTKRFLARCVMSKPNTNNLVFNIDFNICCSETPRPKQQNKRP